MDKCGNQTIGCSVTSCKHNSKGTYCNLSRIQVEPTHDRVTSGNPSDESLCSNYKTK